MRPTAGKGHLSCRHPSRPALNAGRAAALNVLRQTADGGLKPLQKATTRPGQQIFGGPIMS